MADEIPFWLWMSVIAIIIMMLHFCKAVLYHWAWRHLESSEHPIAGNADSAKGLPG